MSVDNCLCLFKRCNAPGTYRLDIVGAFAPVSRHVIARPVTPQISSQTCVSPAETAKQTAKHQKQQKTGPEPKQNTHKIDLPGDAVACPLHHSQKRANELRITAFGQRYSDLGVVDEFCKGATRTNLSDGILVKALYQQPAGNSNDSIAHMSSRLLQ